VERTKRFNRSARSAAAVNPWVGSATVRAARRWERGLVLPENHIRA
jgi:hypothetical protein